MKIRNACLGLLTSITFTCLTAAGAPGADVQTYLLAKGQDYRQTNATEVLSVTNESPFRFITTVEGADTNSVSSVTLALPKKTVHTLTNFEGNFSYEQDFSDKKVFDKSYAKGNYTFTIASLNDGTNKPILALPKTDLYPVTPIIINWQDLQAVEVDQPLNIFWGAFTNGSTNDFVILDISTLDGSRVATTPALTEINQLNGTNLVGQLPAGTLDYSNTYEGRLLFLKKTGENTNSYPGATGVSGYFRQTKFPIVTLPPPPDHGRIQFSARNYSVAENAGTAAITVTRSGHEGDVSVQLFTSGGTATDGLDYTGISTTLHFHDGETSMTIPLTILDDYLLEGNETVNLWLANPDNNSEIGNRTNCVLTILDNETAAAGTLQFNPAVYSLSESNASASLTVTRTGGTVGTVSADFTTQDGSALAGADYVATNGTVVFTGGQTSKVISVPLINDTLHETNKTFSVKLVATTGGAALGASTTGSVTILDDDSGGAISFVSAGVSANENGTNFVVKVIRTGGKASGVTVEYFTAEGTATADVDYISTNGLLTFAAGETNKTILVPIINDTAAEGLESFTLNLTNATGSATLGAISSTTLTIVDDESSISLGTPAITVSEAGGTVTLTAIRSGALLTAVSVDFATLADSAVSPSDYQSTNGTLTFPTNTSSKTIVIPIVNNTLVDNNRTFNLRLSNPQGGVQLGTVTNTAVTITNEDLGGVIAFSTNSYSVAEAGTNATITLIRTGGSAGGVAVEFVVKEGTATAGSDYSNVTQTVVFNAGDTSKKVLVPIINDPIVEGAETILLTLTNVAGGASLGAPTNATLTILDDDLGGVVSFTSAGISANENGTNFVVKVSRTGGKASGVTVEYFTAGGTATPDVDYVSTNGILVFAANETNKTILVPIINDTAAEGSESFTLNLANATGGAALGAISSSTLTIVDDESSISLGTPAITVSEGGTNVSITLTRSGATNTAVSVDFATANLTATNGVDYTGTNGTFTFAAGGVVSKTFLIPIKDNTVVDNSRTFNFRLSNPQGGVQLGTITNSQVTITNDDFGGVIQFASATFSGTEGSNAVITLTRTGGTASGVFIYVSLAGLTATAGLDYTNTSGYVAFNAGETTKTLLVPLVRDTLNENTETVALFFGPVLGGASIGAQNTATLNILNKPDPNAVPLNGPLFISGTVGTVKFSSLTNSCIASSSSNTVLQITASWTTGSGLSTVINQSTVDVSSRQLGTLNLDNSGTHGLATYVQSPLSGAGRTWAVADGSLATGSSGTFTLDAIDYTQKLASGRYTLHMQEITGNVSGGFIDISASFRVALVP